MEAVIHIGSEKTGSTSLQNFLMISRSMLKDRGILYPSSLHSSSNTSQWPLALAASLSYADFADLLSAEGIDNFSQTHSFAKNIPRLLKHEIMESSASRMIVSSEHLSSRIHSKHEVYRVREILEYAGVRRSTIIFYLRHPLLVAASQVSTIVKSGYYVDFSSDILVTLMSQYRPDHIIKIWSDVFEPSNICVRVYLKDTRSNWDIIDDFLSYYDLEIEFEQERDLNQSLSLDSLMCLNQCIRYYRISSGLGDKEFLDVSKLNDLISCSFSPQLKGCSNLSILSHCATKDAIQYGNNQIQRIVDMNIGLTVEDLPEFIAPKADSIASSLWDNIPDQYKDFIFALASECISRTT